MDPTAAWLTITDYRADLEERADAAAALVSWIDTGGFLPVDINMREWYAQEVDVPPIAQTHVYSYCAEVLAEAWRAR